MRARCGFFARLSCNHKINQPVAVGFDEHGLMCIAQGIVSKKVPTTLSQAAKLETVGVECSAAVTRRQFSYAPDVGQDRFTEEMKSRDVDDGSAIIFIVHSGA